MGEGRGGTEVAMPLLLRPTYYAETTSRIPPHRK